MDVALHASWGVAVAAFVAGLASFFSPCVAPLVPGYIGYLSGAAFDAPEARASGSGRTHFARLGAAAPISFLFVAGFSLAFVALGLASASFGRLLIAYQPVLETLAGIVMLVMGAFLLELLPRGLTQFLLREGRVHLNPGALSRLGWLAPVGLGVIFAAGWTPCIGPVLAAILVYVGASADRWSGALLLALYALGFAVPFLSIGLGWSVGLRALGWFKRHSRAVTVASGIALILVGLVYLTGQVSVFASWAQQVSTPVFQ